MIRLHVDGKPVSVDEGATILDAARSIGMMIPTLCHAEGLPHHTSCMVCLVEEEATGAIQPACSTPAQHLASIRTDTPRAIAARRASLELLLSEHAGDCEAPCTRACPAHPDIPRVMRRMVEGDSAAALETLLERLPLAATLAAICPAPCEKSCRRTRLDGAVGIRGIKTAAVREGLAARPGFTPSKALPTGRRVAIVGAGPAGLSAAFHLARQGHECFLVDERESAGGAMRVSTRGGAMRVSASGGDMPAAEGEARRIADALEVDVSLILRLGVGLATRRAINGPEDLEQLRSDHDAVVLAVGSPDRLSVLLPGGSFDGKTHACGVPGLFACGNAARRNPTRLAVQSVADGAAAAISVQRFLAGLPLEEAKRRFDSHFGKLQTEDIAEIARRRAQRLPTDLPEARGEAGRCLSCDCFRGASCRLRLLAEQMEVDGRRFPGEELRRLTRVAGANGLSFEPGKCIKCGICVRIAERDGDRPGLGFSGRGFSVRVSVPLGADLGSALPSTARECVSRCPTGALAWQG